MRFLRQMTAKSARSAIEKALDRVDPQHRALQPPSSPNLRGTNPKDRKLQPCRHATEP